MHLHIQGGPCLPEAEEAVEEDLSGEPAAQESFQMPADLPAEKLLPLLQPWP